MHEEIVFSDEYLIKNKKKDEPIGEGSFRADNRVKQIFDLIPRDMEVKNILDVGCAGVFVKFFPSHSNYFSFL